MGFGTAALHAAQKHFAYLFACPFAVAPPTSLCRALTLPVQRRRPCLHHPQHGWQFAGSGTAVELPQSQPGAPKATACSSGRSCAVAYPTAQRHGLLWVWLEPGAAGRAASAAAPLPELPAADQEGREWFEVSPW